MGTEEDKERVFQDIISAVVSAGKNGRTEYEMIKDYREFNGRPIPFDKVGVQSEREVIHLMLMKKRLYTRGDRFYAARVEGAEHLQKLTMQQKSTGRVGSLVTQQQQQRASAKTRPRSMGPFRGRGGMAALLARGGLRGRSVAPPRGTRGSWAPPPRLQPSAPRGSIGAPPGRLLASGSSLFSTPSRGASNSVPVNNFWSQSTSPYSPRPLVAPRPPPPPIRFPPTLNAPLATIPQRRSRSRSRTPPRFRLLSEEVSSPPKIESSSQKTVTKSFPSQQQGPPFQPLPDPVSRPVPNPRGTLPPSASAAAIEPTQVTRFSPAQVKDKVMELLAERYPAGIPLSDLGREFNVRFRVEYDPLVMMRRSWESLVSGLLKDVCNVSPHGIVSLSSKLTGRSKPEPAAKPLLPPPSPIPPPPPGFEHSIPRPASVATMESEFNPDDALRAEIQTLLGQAPNGIPYCTFLDHYQEMFYKPLKIRGQEVANPAIVVGKFCDLLHIDVERKLIFGKMDAPDASMAAPVPVVADAEAKKDDQERLRRLHRELETRPEKMMLLSEVPKVLHISSSEAKEWLRETLQSSENGIQVERSLAEGRRYMVFLMEPALTRLEAELRDGSGHRLQLAEVARRLGVEEDVCDAKLNKDGRFELVVDGVDGVFVHPRVYPPPVKDAQVDWEQLPIPSDGNFESATELLVEVMVGKVESPHRICVRLAEKYPELHQLMKDMKAFYGRELSSEFLVSDLQPGCDYALKTDSGEWRRVRVVDVISSSAAAVQELDRGDEWSDASINDMRFLTSGFCGLPAQAIFVALARVKKSEGGPWSADCAFRLSQLCQVANSETDGLWLLYLGGETDGVPSVELMKTEGESQIGILDTLREEGLVELEEEDVSELEEPRASLPGNEWDWERAIERELADSDGSDSAPTPCPPSLPSASGANASGDCPSDVVKKCSDLTVVEKMSVSGEGRLRSPHPADPGPSPSPPSSSYRTAASSSTPDDCRSLSRSGSQEKAGK